MQPWFAKVLEKALLGIAQHVFAHHSQRKASPPSLTASLFLGASDLFEGCSKSIHDADTQGLKLPPEEFKCAPHTPLAWLLQSHVSPVYPSRSPCARKIAKLVGLLCGEHISTTCGVCCSLVLAMNFIGCVCTCAVA